MVETRQVVVGAAIVRDGRVLACRRTAPPEAAGRWELPGGKVEPGEAPEAALVREVREELGCDIAVTAWLADEAPIGDRTCCGSPSPRSSPVSPTRSSTTPSAGWPPTSSTTSTGSTPTARSSRAVGGRSAGSIGLELGSVH